MMFVRLTQLLNVRVSIFEMLADSATLVKDVQLSKAPDPMLVTLFGIMISARIEYLKAFAAILLTGTPLMSLGIDKKDVPFGAATLNPVTVISSSFKE